MAVIQELSVSNGSVYDTFFLLESRNRSRISLVFIPYSFLWIQTTSPPYFFLFLVCLFFCLFFFFYFFYVSQTQTYSLDRKELCHA